MVETLATLVPNAGALNLAVLEALDQLGLGVLVKNMGTGRYEVSNASAARILGVEPQAVVGAQDSELFDVNLSMAIRAADLQAQAVPSGVRAEHKLEIGGERRDLLVWRQPVSIGNTPHLLSVWQDVTQIRQREQQLQTALSQLEQQQKANEALRRDVQDNQVRDTVSGLYHRAHFEEQLRREADLSSREQREFALVAIAVDNMDEIRRLHGVEGCERVVESLGRLLRANTRAMDSPCRLGGDRFVVLLSGVGLATAHSRMEHLRRACTQHIVPFNGQQIPFTVCMGVSSFPHTAGSVEELMRSADRALSSARDKGGNRIVLASIQFVPAT
ncbi:MAG: GGDEF domain-containing protein [Aquabacterium sp.]|uniref:GGDEF domain-containing protein n=1 Tax=Aquabacterium sp. TaxID=1872578 RepID=UPI003BDE0ECE